jgi:tetratricopeptide (TPR) repeat protein
MRRLIVLVLAIGLMVGWGLAYRRLTLMDGVPASLSRPGLHGLVLYLRHDWAGAARKWRESRPGQPPAYVDDTAGAAAVHAGDLALAERRARTTMLLVPSSVAPRLTLAEVALDRGKPAEAIEHLQSVLAQQPDHVDALLLTAVARTRRNEDRPAIAAFNRALRHNSAGSRPTLFLRMLELAGDLAPPGGPPRSLCLLAHLHRYLRIFDEAHAELVMDWARQAVAARDHPADAYLAMGIALDKQGRHVDALAAFQQAIAAEPRHPEALRWAGVQGQKLHDPVLQFRMAKAALEAAPADPYYLGVVDHVMIKWFRDAHTTAALMRRVIDADPKNAGAHERLAQAAAQMGDAERSAAHARRAAELRGQRSAP